MYNFLLEKIPEFIIVQCAETMGLSFEVGFVVRYTQCTYENFISNTST